MKNNIKTYSSINCHLCNCNGEPLYKGLNDKLFDTPQGWGFRKCQNDKCNLIWIDPMPLPEDLGKAYETYYTHQEQDHSSSPIKAALGIIQNGYYRQTYGYKQGVGPAWYKYFSSLAYLHPLGIDMVRGGVMFLENNLTGKKLLEVGCGSGEALKSMSDKGWEVEGIDFDLNAVRQANSIGISAKHGTLADQNYISNSFDAVYLSHVLEHVPDPKSFLEECYRVLKKDAKLVITTPNTDSLGHKIYKENWRGLEPPRHLYLFNNKNILMTLQAIGFSSFDIRTSSRGAYYILEMSKILRRSHTSKISNIGSKKFSRMNKLTGYISQIVESLAMIFSSSLGEEIIVICKK
jgi:2-polyprenyl-3-methyl-5-hydroxy-6-metoxy-1,4-benzoquinol methylase